MEVSEGKSTQRELHYSGHVQGVGFRYTVRSLAAGFDVTGFVRNISDGGVQLVVEGTAAEIDALLDAIISELGNYIRDVRQTQRPAAEKFDSFDIRF
jgi:acylphosphatase